MPNFFDKKTLQSNEVKMLTDRLNKLEQERKEDLFFFIFVVILIIDTVLFTILKDGLAAITIGVLQIIFLLSIANRLDIEYLDGIFKKCVSIFKSKKSQ